MSEQKDFFASCPKGLEGLLAEELQALGADDCQLTVAGVSFKGTLSIAYRVCLWSRLANRLLMPLAEAPIDSDQDLYDCAFGVPWADHFNADARFKISFVGTNKAIRHSGYGVQRVKDAVVDYFQAKMGQRPNVDLQAPDIQLHAALAKNRITLSLVLSGESLHRRGYRVKQTPAPLKENLAAALLIRAGWSEQAASAGSCVDPMCGSGTLLLEAMLMATDTAPGLVRMMSRQIEARANIRSLAGDEIGAKAFGFHTWLGHQIPLWLSELESALERHLAGLSACSTQFIGTDAHPGAIAAAKANVAACGLLTDHFHLSVQPISSLSAPALFVADNAASCANSGLVITNPPYGERLGELEGLIPVYENLGAQLKALFPGWQAAVFTADKQLGGALRLRPKKKYRFMNGTIPSELLCFDLVSGEQATLRVEKTGVQTLESLSAGAEMVLNRLRKNEKRLRRWRRKAQVSCYRLYDADMPEYACAIDVYDDQVHVQEYAAPKKIPPNQAAHRFEEVLAAVSCFAQVPIEQIPKKVRRRTVGTSQYEKQNQGEDSRDRSDFFVVKEGAAQLRVNLNRYLDTGLFLDHRPLRHLIYESAKGKRFLNLFCYTATATVQAALGGAKSSVSVDLSQTYLRWAAENFALNQIDPAAHRLVNADCREWLAQCQDEFDLIMLDPPTFSNSKKMEGVLDIQRDHVGLIRDAVSRLSTDGVLYFSTNQRTFKLDTTALNAFCQVQEMSAETIDEDFQRNARIHQCWRIQLDTSAE